VNGRLTGTGKWGLWRAGSHGVIHRGRKPSKREAVDIRREGGGTKGQIGGGGGALLLPGSLHVALAGIIGDWVREGTITGEGLL